MALPVIDLTLPGQCADDAQICRFVADQTGNQTAADVADVLVGVPLALLGIFVLFLVVRWAVHRLIDRVVHRAEVGVLPEKVGRFSLGHVRSAATALDPAISARRAQRARTMGSVLKSIATGVLTTVVATMMLSEVGVDIAPIIASAGIVGVALGFGAQSLVKDFLSGMFMIVEDQYGVGDTIDVGEAVGVVEAVTLRVTRLRDVNGTVWWVPNGQIVRVGNQSQNWSRTVLDIGVGYREDLIRVRRVLEEVAHGLWDDEDFRDEVIEAPSVWGVQDLAPDQVTMRLVLKTTPGSQFEVAREMRERIKARFDQEGIEIPFPQRVVWQRQEPVGAEQAEVEEGCDAHGAVVSTFYDQIGGYDVIEKIVAVFYAGVAEDDVLRPLYPEQDLGPAEERFRLFLVQYWGGPTTYSETRGHPRLRMRHAPFAVTPEAKEHWLHCFRAGLDAVDLTPEQDAQFWDYVTHAAQFMVNRLE